MLTMSHGERKPWQKATPGNSQIPGLKVRIGRESEMNRVSGGEVMVLVSLGLVYDHFPSSAVLSSLFSSSSFTV